MPGAQRGSSLSFLGSQHPPLMLAGSRLSESPRAASRSRCRSARVPAGSACLAQYSTSRCQGGCLTIPALPALLPQPCPTLHLSFLSCCGTFLCGCPCYLDRYCGTAVTHAQRLGQVRLHFRNLLDYFWTCCLLLLTACCDVAVSLSRQCVTVQDVGMKCSFLLVSSVALDVPIGTSSVSKQTLPFS